MIVFTGNPNYQVSEHYKAIKLKHFIDNVNRRNKSDNITLMDREIVTTPFFSQRIFKGCDNCRGTNVLNLY